MGAFLGEHEVNCPYCGEPFSVVVDPTAGPQTYIEDCAVCCRPVQLSVAVDEAGEVAAVTASREDD